MTEELDNETESLKSTRRTALKAGVGVGIGVVAWTGPTITSLTGTPAYAKVCTVPASIDELLADKRNVDSRSSCASREPLGGISWHADDINSQLPSGYTINLSSFEGACSLDGATITFTNPSTARCQLQIRIFNTPDQPANTIYKADSGPGSSTGGVLTLPPVILEKTIDPDDIVPSPPAAYVVNDNAFYNIAFVCVEDENPNCFPPGF